MLSKVLVIVFICFKLDYTASLPDIIRIGEDFSLSSDNKKTFVEKKILFHEAQGDTRIERAREGDLEIEFVILLAPDC